MNFGFLSTFFYEKLPKMFKTEIILANVTFFVKVISRKKKRCCYRSAGACPPRSLKQNEKRPQPKSPWTFFETLGTARDRPSPYGARRGFLRFTVARGPVPRDLPTETKTVRSPETPDGFCDDRGTARDRPSPYGERGRFWHGEGQARSLRFGDAVRIVTK